jgi:hypothetical protein
MEFKEWKTMGSLLLSTRMGGGRPMKKTSSNRRIFIREPLRSNEVDAVRSHRSAIILLVLARMYPIALAEGANSVLLVCFEFAVGTVCPCVNGEFLPLATTDKQYEKAGQKL